MVKLDKWEEVQHEDVKVGDRLKIVATEKGLSPVLTTEIYKGMVEHISHNGDFYLTDGSVWENVDIDPEVETTTVYRRKASYRKPFKLPTELGAIISGRPRGFIDRTFMVFDGGDWSTAHNAYSTSDVVEDFTDLRVERKGIKQ